MCYTVLRVNSFEETFSGHCIAFFGTLNFKKILLLDKRNVVSFLSNFKKWYSDKLKNVGQQFALVVTGYILITGPKITPSGYAVLHIFLF